MISRILHQKGSNTYAHSHAFLRIISAAAASTFALDYLIRQPL